MLNIFRKILNKRKTSTQAEVDLVAIQEGIAILRDGRKKLVIEAKPVNFFLKSEAEQDYIIEVFRVFMNSMSPENPIQFYIKSRPVNIKDYIDRYRTANMKRSGKAATVAEADIKMIQDHIRGQSVLSRSFYLIFTSEIGDFESARKQLELRYDMAANILPRRGGVKLRKLSDRETLELFCDYYGTTCDVDGDEPSGLQNVVAPKTIDVAPSYIKCGDTYATSFFVNGYPSEGVAGWLKSIINFDGVLDISFHVSPVSMEIAAEKLQKELRKGHTSIGADQLSGMAVDQFTLAAYNSIEDLQRRLATGEERMFEFGFYVTLKGGSPEEVEDSAMRMKTVLNSLLMKPYRTTYEGMRAYKTTAPAGKDHIQKLWDMPTSALECFFPFISGELTSDRGVLYGVNKDNKSLVIFDQYSLENPNTVILGTSGGGKTFAASLVATRNWTQGVDVIVEDPERGFKRLCLALQGQYIELSSRSPARINPCELSQAGEVGELNRKALYLNALISLLFEGRLTNEEKNDLDEAIWQAYADKGITKDPATHSKQAPLLADIQKILLEGKGSKNLAAGLKRYTEGSYSYLFSDHTNVDIEKSFIVIDTRDLEDEVRRVAHFIVSGWVWDRVRRDLKRRMFIADEVHQLLAYEDTGKFMFDLVKRSRKYNLGVTSISQDVEDMLNEREGKMNYGRALVTNAATTLLLKQNPAALDAICETFKLSEGERAFLVAADVGEGVLLAGGNHIALSFRIPEDHALYRLITTRPEETIEYGGYEEEADKE